MAMGTMTARFRGKRRTRLRTRQVVHCTGLRQTARVESRKPLRTADYDQVARDRLGEAVTKAREAMGHKFRPSFAALAKISKRSLADLETGKPTVGEANLRAVGAVVPTWTEDSPRIILEGGPIPPLPPASVDSSTSESDGAIPLSALDRIAVMPYRELAERITEIEELLGKDVADRYRESADRIRREAAARGQAILGTSQD